MYCDGPCTGWEYFQSAWPFFVPIGVIALLLGYWLYRRIKRKKRDP